MEAVNGVLKVADSYLSVLHTNPYLSGAISVFLVLYASLAAPKLPPFIASMFENTLFKILIFFLILAVRSYNPTVALLVAIGFLISMQTLSKYRIFAMAGELNLLSAVKSGVKSVSDTISSLSSEKFDDKQYPGAGPEHSNLEEHGHIMKAAGPQPGKQDTVHPPVPQQTHLMTSEPNGYPGRDLASYGLPDSEL